MSVVKVCGAMSRDDLRLLAEARVDLVGLWCGVTGGHADRSPADVRELAEAARATPGLGTVLVTLLGDLGRLHDALDRTGIGWIQLHGYQAPGVVRALKARGDVTVVKALHLLDGECQESVLIPAYERAGTDYFLLDTVHAGRLGSTGTRSGRESILAVADRLHTPFLLAGGISADSRTALDAVVGHPRFHGVDIDSAARDDAGRLHSGRVAAVVARWRSTPADQDHP